MRSENEPVKMTKGQGESLLWCENTDVFLEWEEFKFVAFPVLKVYSVTQKYSICFICTRTLWRYEGKRYILNMKKGVRSKKWQSWRGITNTKLLLIIGVRGAGGWMDQSGKILVIHPHFLIPRTQKFGNDRCSGCIE